MHDASDLSWLGPIDNDANEVFDLDDHDSSHLTGNQIEAQLSSHPTPVSLLHNQPCTESDFPVDVQTKNITRHCRSDDNLVVGRRLDAQDEGYLVSGNHADLSVSETSDALAYQPTAESFNPQQRLTLN